MNPVAIALYQWGKADPGAPLSRARLGLTEADVRLVEACMNDIGRYLPDAPHQILVSHSLTVEVLSVHEALVRGGTEGGRTPEEIASEARMLLRLLSAGIDAGHFPLTTAPTGTVRISPPHTIDLEAGWGEHRTNARYEIFRRECLGRRKKLSPRLRSGRLLLSLVLCNAVCTGGMLHVVAKSLVGQLRAAGSLVYCDNVLRDRSRQWSVVRRTHLRRAVTILAIQDAAFLAKYLVHERTRFESEAFTLIREYLEFAGAREEHLPTSLVQLLKETQQYLSLNAPRFILALVTNEIVATEFSERNLRNIQNLAPKHDDSARNFVEVTEADVREREIPLVSPSFWERALEKAIAQPNEEAMRSALGALRGAPDVPSSARVVAHLGEHLLNDPSCGPAGRRKGGGRQGTLGLWSQACDSTGRLRTRADGRPKAIQAAVNRCL